MDLINKFNMKVIILTRNLMDVLASLSDHLNDYFEYIPMSYINGRILRSIDNSTKFTRLQYLVHYHLPWYLSFYAGWVNHSKEISNRYVFFLMMIFFDKDELFKSLLNSLELDIKKENIK